MESLYADLKTMVWKPLKEPRVTAMRDVDL